MTDIASLRMAIETGDVRRANAELDKLERAAGRNTASAGALAGAYGKLGGALAVAYATVNGGREFIRLSDVYAGMTGRLALVTKGSADLARVQRELFSTAQQTGVGLVQTSDLYASLARGTEALGLAQSDVLSITRTINQSLAISGASATSAAAALVQLNQAFSSGVLRGEELNSVLEQAPALARAIADGLGVPIGQLRKLGEAGALTAEKVAAALLKSGAVIDAQFGRMPLTVGRASTEAANSILQLVGQVDRLTGTSGTLAGVISQTARGIDSFGDSLARAAAGDGGAGAFANAIVTAAEALRVFWADLSFVSGGVGREVGAVLAQLTLVYEVLRSPPDQLVETARRNWAGYNAISEAVKADAERAREELDRLTNRVLTRNAAGRSTAGQGRGDFEGYLRAPEDRPAGGGSGGAGGKKADPYGDELKSLRERLVLVGQNTEADRIAAQIGLGKFGKINPSQQAALQALASEIDRREQNVRLLQEEGSAREAASRLSQASLASSLAETQRLIDGNQALRDEIELLGATANAKTAIEVARTSSARALLEERAAILANVEGNEAEVQSLRQQIDLLRQREGLLTQRQDRQNFLEPVKDMPKDAANETYTSVRDALAAAFRDTKNPVKAFAEGLGNAIFSRVTSRLADALASQIVGTSGSGGLLGSLLSAAGSFLGGGVPVGNGTGATGDFARFDRKLATGTNYVPYDGMKATLHEGEAVIPKRYNPAAGGAPMGGTRVVLNYAPNVNIDARSDQAQIQQLVARTNAEGQQQMLQRLADLGVL